MIELGRAPKTIFLARYLRRALQREIHEGVNVVESWNCANSVIFFGKGGDLASNDPWAVEVNRASMRPPDMSIRPLADGLPDARSTISSPERARRQVQSG